MQRGGTVRDRSGLLKLAPARDYVAAQASLTKFTQSLTDQIAEEIKTLESEIEARANKRQEFQTAFENFDQKANQLFNILSMVLKNQKEMTYAVTRNAL